MSFDNWYNKNKTRTWIAMPWLKDELKVAYEAGRKSAKKPKRPVEPKKDK